MKWGALLILSNPPVTTISEWPRKILEAPILVDLSPDAQTLLIFQHGTVWDISEASATYLAGFWPNPVERTFPKMTSEIYLLLTLVSCNNYFNG